MTAITLVGVGTGASGDNATLHPAIPAGAVAGDLILVFATHRNVAGTAACAGYGLLQSAANMFVFAKQHSGTETAPTVTFSGGVSGDTTLAQVAVFRTAAPIESAFATLSNASAQNIALPTAATPDRNNSLLLVLGWKQDDWTSVAALTGMTEIGEVSSTTGNDASMIWYYQVQTTAAASTAGPLTVTGGASAVSRGMVLGIYQAVTVTATEQDVYPPRVQVAVTNLVLGDSVEVYRVVGGDRTLVRAGSDAAVTDTSFVVIDAELPFGVPVSYVAVVNGTDAAVTAPDSYYLPGQKVAVTDAITGLAAEVVIVAWPDKPRARQSSTFVAGGRNIAVLGNLVGFTGTIDVYVETTSAAENLTAVLENATSGIVQIRQPGGYDGVDSYVAVLGVTEHRFSQDGSDQRRTFSLDVLQVDGWAGDLEARGFSYADVEAAYVGLTYADAEGDFVTYLDAELADWSG